MYFRSPPSYEDGANYFVTITVEDEDGLRDTLNVDVTVTDVEEEGVVTIEPQRGWDGAPFRAMLTDEDGGVSGNAWQWQRSSNRSSWSDIPGATSATYFPTPDVVGDYLRATVTYADSRGGSKSAMAALKGRLGDSNDRPGTNNAPEFEDTTAERSIGQGHGGGPEHRCAGAGQPTRTVTTCSRTRCR